MEFVKSDGGRKAAGFKGKAGDCFARAVAIATHRPYREVYDLINEVAKGERTGKRKRDRSCARTGVYKYTVKKVMESFGWEWVPTMRVGTGCRVHVRSEELPSSGPLVLNLSKHFSAVVDGVLYDAYDSSRDGTRCVYGYWQPAHKELARHIRDSISMRLVDAGIDELRVVDFVVERLMGVGRKQYGELVLKTDKRNFSKELDEELLDAIVYIACARLKREESK
jgi:hypothetical protein